MWPLWSYLGPLNVTGYNGFVSGAWGGVGWGERLTGPGWDCWLCSGTFNWMVRWLSHSLFGLMLIYLKFCPQECVKRHRAATGIRRCIARCRIIQYGYGYGFASLQYSTACVSEVLLHGQWSVRFSLRRVVSRVFLAANGQSGFTHGQWSVRFSSRPMVSKVVVFSRPVISKVFLSASGQ